MTDLTDTIKEKRAQTADLLRAHGITPTSQRIEIAEVFLCRSQHMSAERILAELMGRVRVSKATVYNSLKLFAERGLIRQVNVHSDRLIYDSNVRPHYHFYNVDTGELTDLDPGQVELHRLPQPPAGTVAEDVEIVIKVRNASRDR